MGTSISNIITVTTPVLTIVPGAATALTLTNITTTTLTFSWSAPTSGSQPFTYQPQQSVSGSGVFSNIGGSTTATSVNVTGLAPNVTYIFQVVTSNSAGSTISATVSGTTLPVLPGAPSGLAVVGSPTQTSISLQWNAPSVGTGPFTYQVSFATPSGSGTFTPFSTTTTATSQSIGGLSPGTGYDFVVTASNTVGAGPPSATLVNVQTAGAVANAPGPATALIVSNLASTSLTLSWTAPTSGATPFTYQPQASVSGGSFANIGSSTTAALTTIMGLTPGTMYQFQIVTSNSTTATSTSSSVSATTPSVLPSAPTGLAVNGSPTNTSVTLQWTAPATGTTPLTYQVLDRTPSGSGSFVTAGATTTAVSQTITGLSPASSYDFEVTAANSAGTGPASAVLTGVMTASGTQDPAPVTNLVVSNLTTTSLTLAWSPPATGTTPFTYQVQQALSGSSSFANVGSTTMSTSTSVTGLSPGTGYQFQVVTTNSVSSSTSVTVSATTLSVLPGAPTGLAQTSSPTSSSISLQWVAPSTGTPPLTYQVLSRTPTGTGSFTAAAATTTALSQTITGLAASTSYDVEVEAINAAGTSPASTALTNIVTAANAPPTAPSTPTNLAAGTVTSSSIQANWTASAAGTAPISYVLQYQVHQGESAAKTTVPPAASLNASPTPGSAGSGNIITIVGAQVAVNGTVITATAGVTELFYGSNHTAYQFNGSAWFGPIIAGNGGTQVPTPS